MTADEAREQHCRTLTVLRGMLENAAELQVQRYGWVELPRLSTEAAQRMLDALEDACDTYELEAQRVRVFSAPLGRNGKG